MAFSQTGDTMNTPTKPATAADYLADAHARLLGAGIAMADAVAAAQTEGLPCAGALHAMSRALLDIADAQNDVLENLGQPKPPTLELIPGGITSHGLCRHCGRIGDHGTSCPEVSE